MIRRTENLVAYRSRVSRRDFLKAAGSGVLLTPTTAAAIPSAELATHGKIRWDRQADIVVVGSGAAGSTAALFAKEAGASVLLLEKGVIYGGTTAKSGGIMWIPNNYMMKAKGLQDSREGCIRYMARTAYPTLYNANDSRLGIPGDAYDLLGTFYDNASGVVDSLKELLVIDKYAFWLRYDGELYPDYYGHLPEDTAPTGRSIIPATPDGIRGDGGFMISKLKEAVDKRNIPVLLEHRATRLIVNGKGEIIGLEAKTGEGHSVLVRAHKAVIFGTGGFTANPEMALNFLKGPIFGGCTVPTGEGDFVYMATSVGAKLANMNNAWWWPVILEQALQSRSVPAGIGQPPGDSMIQVNRHGLRCVNEKIQYNERNQSHFVWDPHGADYPNLIQFVIYDQFCRDRFGENSGLILKAGLAASYVLSGATLEDLAKAIDQRLSEIAGKTGNVRLDSNFIANLRETISRFNSFADSGKDLDFHRGETPVEFAFFGPRRPGNDKPNLMMYPISSKGPYYAVMLGSGTLDTKGGPKTNAMAQVVDANDKPIPGLYGAGNCIAAPAAQAYWAGGGTLGLAITFGAIAAKNAAKEQAKQEV